MENNENNVVNGEEPKTMTFDEMLASNKEYQSEFDRRLTKSNNTFLENKKSEWEKEYTERLQREKTEAEKLAKMSVEQQLNYKISQLEKELQDRDNKLNASQLRDTTNNILIEKGIPSSYLKMFDFNNETADSINSKVELLSNIRSQDLEDNLNKTLREDTPSYYNNDNNNDNETDPYIAGFMSEL